MTRRFLPVSFLLLALLMFLTLLAAGPNPARSAAAASAKSDAGANPATAKPDAAPKIADSAKPADSAILAAPVTPAAAPKPVEATPAPTPATPAPTPAAPAKPKVVLVKADEATLRADASNKSKALDTFTQFTPVQALGTQDKYTKVQVGDKTGFIYSESLTDSPFVSTTVSGKDKANVRATAEPDAQVLISLGAHWPLKVLAKEGKRVKVVDCDGDGGWVYESYLSLDRYVIATPPAGQGDWINLRDKPGLDKTGKVIGARRFMAQKGTLFSVVREENGWLLLRYSDGDEGWASANIVWGWSDK